MIDSILNWIISDPTGIILVIVLVSLVFVGFRAARGAQRDERLELRLNSVRLTRTTQFDKWLDNQADFNADVYNSREALVKRMLGWFVPLVHRLPIFGEKDKEKLRRNLVIAGFRSDDALNMALAAKLVVGIFFGLGAYSLLTINGYLVGNNLAKFFAVIGGCIVGSVVLEMAVQRKAKQNQEKIRESLADALDLLVICSRAGLSLDAALSRVSRELALTAPVLTRELQHTEAELRFLPSRKQALENLVDRTQVKELQAFVSTLVQSERFGTPLSQAFAMIAQENRIHRLQQTEEKAAKIPAWMTLPIIGLIMPAVMVVMGGPAIIATLKMLATD